MKSRILLILLLLGAGCTTHMEEAREIIIDCPAIDVDHEVNIIVETILSDEQITQKINSAFSADAVYFDYNYQADWINSTDFVYLGNNSYREFNCSSGDFLVRCRYTRFSTLNCTRT